MRIVGAVWMAALGILLAGCGAPDKDRPASSGDDARVVERRTQDETSRAAEGRSTTDGRVFLTVKFPPGQTLRYKFTSTKDIAIDWDPNAAASANRVQQQSERLEMVVAYTPVGVDPNGVSTIRAVVESLKAERTGGPGSRHFGPDAVETARGQSFTLKVDARGRIVDSSELAALIQEMGKQAFRADRSMGRVKEPDMIWDFIAGQWFLWDAEATVERPAEGVAVGQTWPSRLCVPAPMVMRRARSVVYQLAEVRQNAGQPPKPDERQGQAERSRRDGLVTQGRDALAASAPGPLAVIRSTYTSAEAAPAGWPIPYSGRMQMSGTFGFLLSYEVLGLEGAGEELFDLQAGRIERRQEKYTLRVKAGLPPMGIKASPHIKIEQMLTMELQ